MIPRFQTLAKILVSGYQFHIDTTALMSNPASRASMAPAAKSLFADICRFCEAYNGKDALKTNSTETEGVRDALENLKEWAERLFPKYLGVPLKVEVSRGSANFPRVPWIAVLPPKQAVSSGVYFVACFGREGGGAVAGCATSVTSRTALKTVTRSRRSTLQIDVNGKSGNTHYNDAFANPLEITLFGFSEARFKKHVEDSLEIAFNFIQGSQNPAPAISDMVDVETADDAAEHDELEESKNEESSDGTFDPTNMEDARKAIQASIKLRQGQSKFRRKLLKAYGSKCAVTGCSIPALLEAAHIMPYRGTHTNYPSNGLLLRADIHTLFDLNLLTVDPSDFKVAISPLLQHTEYSEMAGRTLLVPRQSALQPDRDALQWRRLFAPRRKAR